MLYNFYWYQLVREVNGVDEWAVYVTKAYSHDNARELAQKHAEILDDETSHVASSDRERWQLHAISKFDMSRINSGLPVLVANLRVPILEEVSRSDVSNA